MKKQNHTHGDLDSRIKNVTLTIEYLKEKAEMHLLLRSPCAFRRAIEGEIMNWENELKELIERGEI